jgi:hypothetical protein
MIYERVAVRASPSCDAPSTPEDTTDTTPAQLLDRIRWEGAARAGRNAERSVVNAPARYGSVLPRNDPRGPVRQPSSALPPAVMTERSPRFSRISML